MKWNLGIVGLSEENRISHPSFLLLCRKRVHERAWCWTTCPLSSAAQPHLTLLGLCFKGCTLGPIMPLCPLGASRESIWCGRWWWWWWVWGLGLELTNGGHVFCHGLYWLAAKGQIQNGLFLSPTHFLITLSTLICSFRPSISPFIFF